jgi:hypothetical protein
MTDVDRIEQIRRAHKSARPNPAANPAWANAENDIGVLLDRIDELERRLATQSVVTTQVTPSLATCQRCKDTRVVEVDDDGMPCPECCCWNCGVAPGEEHASVCSVENR